MPTLPKTTRYRKPETFRGRAWRPYVAALGQLALAWNELHEHLAYLFTTVMPEDNKERTIHVWYSASQDRAAREMLRAALISQPEEFLEKYPAAVEEIRWILGQAHALEEARNNAIHSPLLHWNTDEPDRQQIEPFAFFGHSRATKLAKRPDLLAEFRWCRDTALVLRDYVDLIDDALTISRRPWPKRPSLPNRGQKKGRRGPRHQRSPK